MPGRLGGLLLWFPCWVTGVVPLPVGIRAVCCVCRCVDQSMCLYVCALAASWTCRAMKCCLCMVEGMSSGITAITCNDTPKHECKQRIPKEAQNSEKMCINTYIV